jgi:hypothetical protein
MNAGKKEWARPYQKGIRHIAADYTHADGVVILVCDQPYISSSTRLC